MFFKKKVPTTNITVENLSIDQSIDIVGGRIIINGKEVTVDKNATIHIYIDSHATVKSIKSDRGLVIHGDVDGNIDASAVNCGIVNGDVKADTVNCDDIAGNIVSASIVNCDAVKGSVTAKIVNK